MRGYVPAFQIDNLQVGCSLFHTSRSNCQCLMQGLAYAAIQLYTEASSSNGKYAFYFSSWNALADAAKISVGP